MIVSLSWLKEYVPVEMAVSELAEGLTMAGLEVDSVSDRYAWLETVRVGRVLSVSAHPNADRLKLCDVDLGDRTVRVVCGAPNVCQDMLAPLALPGTRFPGGMVLAKGVIRGEASEGMLCSETELELGDDKGGIMVLPPDRTVGEALNRALGLSDPVIEIDLTPNRPDCLSLIGTAREVAAMSGHRVTLPKIRLPEGEKDIADFAAVTIDAPDHCPRYAARLIENVKIGPSPFWLQDRLISVGLRPISNIVDITNFVMMETGQPLHAFDFDNLAEHRIVVRTAEAGEHFTTLDGKERTLSGDTLMICDGQKPVAVAGVMGGLNSEIEATTTRVLIESACFDPASVRKTAKKLGLNTDASHRFERGVDPDGTLRAMDRAAQLMVEVAGGTLIRGRIDAHPVTVKNHPVDMRVSAINRRLGTSLSRDEMAEMLAGIEFEVRQEADADRLTVLAPSFRVDIGRTEDISEEIARLRGYNNIPVTFPPLPAEAPNHTPQFVFRNRVRDMMAGFGFAEAISYSFISDQSCDRLCFKADDPRRRMLTILNPLTEDQSVMRTTLIPGLLETMQRNLARQNRNLKLFEVGKIFLSNGQERLPKEIEMLAGLWTGTRSDTAWHTAESACDFYDLKGAVEGLFAALGVKDTEFTAHAPDECDNTRPGHTARILAGGQALGIIGEVSPQVLKHYDLKQTAFIFELNLDMLAPFVSDCKQAAPIPKYPATDRDITIIVDRSVEASAILSYVKGLKAPLLEDIFLFDVYEGEKIPEGKKSISFRLVYRSLHKTLQDDDVTEVHQQISDQLPVQFNAVFPG
ncbi:phenylalanine--tRNA ligase subunit beta [Desulfonema ishimotonii]|uniref:Phenylalanine--tRNA ligase beta subunit n=1 Tax=Desulfonema ishimotonii TaxID=45657 RepID=A0A401G219_9BACT|nr:phenylalanine--tRNA ligase subunit beta [Desulfonema ishimotonii]GBC63245.1 phenylalanine--tRNA ligase subunit beta [Desulfonema ishimotonii]